MINFFTNTYTGISDFTSDCKDNTLRFMKNNYYINERGILQGFTASLISSVAAAYLFKCTTPLTGAAFGAVNYVLLNAIVEIIREHKDTNFPEVIGLVGLTSAMTYAFFSIACKVSLTAQATLLLCLASLAGTGVRSFFITGR